eukprot:COSAG01_NODE_3860_length_5618_cov_2.958869_1_plen_111_part_00
MPLILQLHPAGTWAQQFVQIRVQLPLEVPRWPVTIPLVRPLALVTKLSVHKIQERSVIVRRVVVHSFSPRPAQLMLCVQKAEYLARCLSRCVRAWRIGAEVFVRLSEQQA